MTPKAVDVLDTLGSCRKLVRQDSPWDSCSKANCGLGATFSRSAETPGAEAEQRPSTMTPWYPR